MVYNAMKLFMEINPQLFDECSHDYTELQNTAEQRQATRQSKWDQLEEQAKRQQMQNGRSGSDATAASRAGRGMPYARPDEVDPVTQDSQKRLDALKIQDDGGSVRRPCLPTADPV